ncbi:DUF7289 family protein [Archaeoglobus sp.]
MREKGVSEVLGYMYIFGIVMTVLAIVFVQVNTMVEDMKRSVMSQSLEQSFKRIQYIIHSVSFGEVPSQAVEIEMQGGTLMVEEAKPEFILAFVNYTESNPYNLPCSEIPNSHPLCINLSTGSLYDSSSCSGNYNFSACTLNHTIGRLVYGYKDWLLTLEGGSVFSKYSNQDYSRLLYKPRILYNATLTQGTTFLVITIPVVKGDLSIGGTGRFRFFVNEGGNIFSLVEINDLIKSNFSDVYIIIKDTQNGYAWCKFFENSGGYFNITLDPSKTQHSSCYYSTNPTVTIENEVFPQKVAEIIVIFREVVFS